MIKHKFTSIKPVPLVMAVAATMIGCSSLALLSPSAGATPLQQAYVRFDRLAVSSFTSGKVCFKPTTTIAANAANTFKIQFPTPVTGSYTLSTTLANWTTAITGLDAGETGLTITGAQATAADNSAKTVTFTFSNTVTAGTLYCARWTNNTAALQLPATAAVGGTGETLPGTVSTYNSTATLQDASNFSETIVSSGPAADQLTVSGTVPPSFSFALSGTTDPFGNIPINAVTTTTGGRSVTIVTNAPNGWVLWAHDLNSNGGKGSFNSVTSGYKITPNSAVGLANNLGTDTEGYGFAAVKTTQGTGLNPAQSASTASVVAGYDATASTNANAGTLDPTNYQPFATSDGTTNGDVIGVKERVKTSSTTPAANDYADTVTLVGAGRF